MTSIVKATEASKGATKQDRVIAMLRHPKGVTVEAIGKITGWQSHSVRGFFSAVVGKKLGLKLVCHKSDSGRIYRIVGGGKVKLKATTGAKSAGTSKNPTTARAAKRTSTVKAS